VRDGPLHGARILIVEDEAIIALDLDGLLSEAGAVVVGPARTLAAARPLAEMSTLSAAILDVRIGGDMVLPIAAILASRRIPFAFHTADADCGGLLAAWPEAQILTKPSASALIIQTMAKLVTTRSPEKHLVRDSEQNEMSPQDAGQ
jgi:DNA-binding NtrC family response regulator